MPNTIVSTFRGLNERTETTQIDNPDAQVANHVRIDSSGQVHTIDKSHDFVASNGLVEPRGYHINYEGDATAFAPIAGKTFRRSSEYVELSDIEAVLNIQATDGSQRPILFRDGAIAEDGIQNSLFPSYGIPQSENSVLVPLENNQFLVIEANLEIYARPGGLTLVRDREFIRITDARIAISIFKYDGLNLVGRYHTKHVAQKRDALRTPDSLEAVKASFPIASTKGVTEIPASSINPGTFISQFLNWDYTIHNSGNNMALAFMSSYRIGRIQPFGTMERATTEFLHVLDFDISGNNPLDNGSRSHNYNLAETGIALTEANKRTNLNTGMSLAHDGANFYIKGIARDYTIVKDLQTDFVDQQSTNAFVETGGRNYFISNGDSTYLFVPGDGIYNFNVANFTRGSLLTNISGLTNVELLNRQTINTRVYVQHSIGAAQRVRPFIMPAATPETDLTEYPLSYDTANTTLETYKPFVSDSGITGDLINQTLFQTAGLNGFDFENDPISLYGANALLNDFADFFVSEILVGGAEDRYKVCLFFATGVRFNENLFTPPINYCLALVNGSEVEAPAILTFEVSGLGLKNKSSSTNSFNNVDEVFLFANDKGGFDYFFADTTRYEGRSDPAEFSFGDISDQNYESVLGVQFTDAFEIMYQSIARVRGRTAVIATSSSAADENALKKLVLYTDSNPASLNSNSDFFLLDNVDDPVRIVAVNDRFLVIGESRSAFVFENDGIEVSIGTISYNSIASNGNVVFMMNREGIWMLNYHNRSLVTDGILDPYLFESLTDDQLIDASAAIDTEYNIYILSVPALNRIFLYDIRTGSFYGTINIALSTYDAVSAPIKLNTHYGKAYAIQSVTENTPSVVTEWLITKFFANTPSAGRTVVNGTLTQTIPYTTIFNKEYKINPVAKIDEQHRFASRIDIYYTSGSTVAFTFNQIKVGVETTLTSATLPVNSNKSAYVRIYLSGQYGSSYNLRFVTVASDFNLIRYDDAD